jgi:hypothetical protein
VSRAATAQSASAAGRAAGEKSEVCTVGDLVGDTGYRVKRILTTSVVLEKDGQETVLELNKRDDSSKERMAAAEKQAEKDTQAQLAATAGSPPPPPPVPAAVPPPPGTTDAKSATPTAPARTAAETLAEQRRREAMEARRALLERSRSQSQTTPATATTGK